MGPWSQPTTTETIAGHLAWDWSHYVARPRRRSQREVSAHLALAPGQPERIGRVAVRGAAEIARMPSARILRRGELGGGRGAQAGEELQRLAQRRLATRVE